MSTKNISPLDAAAEKGEDGATMERPASVDVDSEIDQIYRNIGITPAEIEHAQTLFQALTIEDACERLGDYLQNHGDDMAIPKDAVETVQYILGKLDSDKPTDDHWRTVVRICATVLTENSVYQEVRAIVDPVDDVNEPVNTIRAWAIGLLWAGGLAGVNQFFSPRQPAITIAAYLAQLFGFLMGKLCAIVLPGRIFLTGTRFEFCLNPGPWSLKEQTLVTIMANVSYATPLITSLFFMQRLELYLGLEWAANFGYGFCILLSTQLLGFGISGLGRRFLVYPSNMVWYFVLSQTAMNKAFIKDENLSANGWNISRLRYFFIVSTGAFCYYWIPGTMMPTATFFNWITWIKPTSSVVAIITGTYYFNLGFNPLSTLDYQWISTIDPFVTPWFILAQIVLAVAFWGLCIILPVFFSNTWFTGYLPPNSWYPYDNTGQIYQSSLVLGADNKLNQTAYEAYSPVFLPAAVALRYIGMFALLPALFVYTFLWNRKLIWPIMKSLVNRDGESRWEGDVHYRLMRQYKEVPEWWYLIIVVVSMGLGFIGLYVWPTNIPGWIFPLAFVASGLFLIPVGILCAVTGYSTDLEILFNVIGGFACKGNPVGTFFFKCLGKSVLSQAIYFTSDMKLGHYNKVPPRVMVTAQVAATVVASLVSLGIVQYQITGIPGICDTSQQQRWICSTVSTNWTSAIIWGALGPQRIFARNSMYKYIPFGLLAGALWPIPWYFARKRWPNSILRYCHPLVMMIAPILWAPLNFSNFWQALPISYVMGQWIKTRYAEWWNKYNYITSTALISGIALSVIIQFVALTNNGVSFPDWWGTTKYMETCDLQDCRWKNVPPGDTFGPTEWS